LIDGGISGVPIFNCEEFAPKRTKYCVLIPIINEIGRIDKELNTAHKYDIDRLCDIMICDGGSTDGSTDRSLLRSLGVNTLLIKEDIGKQSAQLRMGFWWALQRGYEGFITIDGNNKDSIEDIPKFIEKLDEGYDFVQGSRFIRGGNAINTPLIRWLAVRFLHAPIISYTARYKFTDTTNAYRGYSRKYIEHSRVQPFRDVFMSYELLAYLSVRASQLGLRVCEVPVTRAYPKGGSVPTKISPIRGGYQLVRILLKNMKGYYNAL
jgi:dolichol-phosphate mannosyltransferase